MSKGKGISSFMDFMRGVHDVHKGVVENVSTAAKVPVEKRREMARQKLTVPEIMKKANEGELLGKTPRGEPYAGMLVDVSKPTAREVTGLRLPENFQLQFFPRSKYDQVVSSRDPARYRLEDVYNAYMDLDFLNPDAYPAAVSMQDYLSLLPVAERGPYKPRPFHVNAMDAPEGGGSQGYQLLYDLIGASGDANVVSALTSANALRRPMNVANTIYARGSASHIQPMSEIIDDSTGLYSGTSGDSLDVSPAVFPGTSQERSNDVRTYIQGMFPDIDPQVLESSVINLSPSKAVELSQDDPRALAGFLELLGATRARQARIPGFENDPSPGDRATLYDLVQRYHQPGASRSGAYHALGPGALGRARTTEEAILGMRAGMSPEEILQRILNSSGNPEKDFAGRYRRGGLAAAAA